jgi:hypothetical protein
MCLEQRQHVGCHDRHRIAGSNASPLERVGKTPAAFLELAIGEPSWSMDYRGLLGINGSSAR